MTRLRDQLAILLAIIGCAAILPVGQLAHASNLTFGTVQNLSNNSNSCPTSCSSLPRTVALGSHVYVAWLNNTSGNSNLLFRVSSNNGTSFGPVTEITNSTSQGADKEQIAAVGSDVYIVWQQNLTISSSSILFRASINNGTSFGPVINLSNNVLGLSSSALPEIVAIGNNVCVIWLATTTGSKPANEILFKASTSNGSNFATVTAILISSKAYGSALTPLSGPQVAALNTHVYATWIDTTPGKPQTFFAASSNSGASFGTPFSLSNTPTGETDYNQQIAVSRSSVYVAWTNDTANTDNTMFAASNNNGTSFGPALNFNKGTLFDLNPQLAVSANNVYVVWSDTSGNGNTEVLYRASNNNGASFNNILNMSKIAGLSNQQTIASAGSNVYIAWVQSSTANDGVHFISSSDGGSTFGNTVSLSMDTLSSNPTVTGAGSYANVIWEDGSTGNGDIYFAPTVFDFSISNSGPISTIQGSSASVLLTLTMQSGSSQLVSLSCSTGLPTGASCVFNPVSGIPNFVGNLTISTLTSTPTGTYNVTVTGTGGSFSHSAYVALTVKSSGSVGGTVVRVDRIALLSRYLAFAVFVGALTALTVFARRWKRIERSV